MRILLGKNGCFEHIRLIVVRDPTQRDGVGESSPHRSMLKAQLVSGAVKKPKPPPPPKEADARTDSTWNVKKWVNGLNLTDQVAAALRPPSSVELHLQ